MFYDFKCTLCGACLGCEARSISRKEDGSILEIDREKCTVCGKCEMLCLQKANKVCGSTVDTEEIFAQVLRDRIFYKKEGGMTLSGGEPSMQKAAAIELLRLAAENGINTVVETCGYGDRDFFEAAADSGAVFYFDIKGTDRNKHLKNTGVSNEKILDNLNYLFSRKAEVVLRIPLIPGLNDSDEDLNELAEFLKMHNNEFREVQIMKYHILGMSKAKAISYDYRAPDEGAGKNEAERWLRLLGGSCDKISFS